MRLYFIAVMSFFGFSAWVFAATVQNDISIGVFGSEANGRQVYVGVSPNPNNCLNGGVYFQQLGYGGQFRPAGLANIIALAAAAKIADRKIRMDYNISADRYCFGEAIYLQ